MYARYLGFVDLKIKILEDNRENNDDKGSQDTSCLSCSTQIGNLSEDGNPNDDNFMEKWFQLITDWEMGLTWHFWDPFLILITFQWYRE